MRTVIINSIHSDSVRFIRDAKPGIVISFDAHPDLGHWSNPEVVDSIFKLEIPQRIKSALLRTSIQVSLRVVLPESEIISVVPEACVITDFNWNIFLRSFSGNKSEVEFTKSRAIFEWKKKLNNLSIIGHLSPPNTLGLLLERIKGKTVVIDIDADYLFELTQECHTPAGFSDLPVPVYGMPQDNLGSEKSILGFIAKVKPELITLSEITSKALGSAYSNSNRFILSLENSNYSICKGIIYKDGEFDELAKIKGGFDSFYIKQSKLKIYKDFLEPYLDFFESIGLKT